MAINDARVLVWDIENSPLISYTWGTFQQDVIRVKEQWGLLSVSWKWLGESQVHVLGLDDFPGYTPGDNSDYELAKALHALLDEADITIAHNGDKFDTRKAHARFIANGLLPPSPVRSIDTLKVARKYFAFTSNRLGDLGELLGCGKKMETGGFDLWLNVMAGDEKAWKRMKKYNKRDVLLLEDVYLKLRPWMQGHPNLPYLTGEVDACPKCGSDNLTKQGYKYNRTTIMQQYRCNDCGGWCSSRCAEKVEAPSLVN